MTSPDGPPLELLPPDVVIVLDVHGVVINNPLAGFFHDLAERIGIAPTEFIHQWRSTWRLPFWEGRLTETQLWNALAPDIDHQELRNDLERRYAPGPWFDFAANHDGPIWLLSNHRSEWLLPRLERFAILDRFDRIIVSDQIQAAKPDPAAYAQLVEHRNVAYYDDSAVNIATARDLGIRATIVTPGPSDHASTTSR